VETNVGIILIIALGDGSSSITDEMVVRHYNVNCSVMSDLGCFCGRVECGGVGGGSGGGAGVYEMYAAPKPVSILSG
jgi:hypothetical protein